MREEEQKIPCFQKEKKVKRLAKVAIIIVT